MEEIDIKLQKTIEDHNIHIKNVNSLIEKIIYELKLRGANHDKTKNQEPELASFARINAKLKDLDYGSDAYNESLKELGPAIKHHYANNRHHPEYFKNGINDMDLVDLIEMFCDWKAASMRHNSGNIRTSIDFNEKRFKISEQLVKIFENTIKYFD